MMRLLASALLLLTGCDYQASTNRWPPPIEEPALVTEDSRPQIRQKAKPTPTTKKTTQTPDSKDRMRYDFDKMEETLRPKARKDQKDQQSTGQ